MSMKPHEERTAEELWMELETSDTKEDALKVLEAAKELKESDEFIAEMNKYITRMWK